MKISQLASKPQLIKVTIDSEDILKEFGEAVEFWTWDRQPLDVFMKLAQSENGNQAQIIEIVKTLILDEQGKQVIQGENMVPPKVLVASISKVVEILGK